MDGSLTCAACGQANPATFRFCGVCGAGLVAEPAVEVRKTVTVVFCDLVGSTALGERTDPEVLRQLMSRYHAELRAILERHGGTVEKFIGDAAMAIFGLPVTHEDDALRAVRASLEMHAAVAALGLEVRIGVNTGEVVAGAGETLVTGDAVNSAARLEQSAAAGEILVGASTERLVRDRIRTEALDPLQVRGKSEPLAAFRVLGLADELPTFIRPADTPFVGRRDELEGLGHALALAFEGHRPQLATIVGPAGIGKSRLTREFLRRLEAQVVVGRCLSYGEGITYWPVAEIVAQIGDVPAVLAGSIDADLAADRLAAAVGGREIPTSPEEIAWGVRKLFEALASQRPTVVVFEDVHWAEPVLLDLIEYVATFSQGVPLLLLCAARPDLFEDRPAWSAPRPNATLVTLEPLSEADSEALVMGLGELSADTKARIIEAAEGNPLFVEQLVAMQAEAGLGALVVPPTLQALLAARIDRLAAQERAVVERGSVEGRLFHRGSVTALLPPTERRDVGANLLTLVRKAFIRPDRAALPGDDGFRFGHILIRDAAYEAIPKRLRASLHERFADWLVSRLGDDVPAEILGYHLEQAYRFGAELEVPNQVIGMRAAQALASAARTARARRDLTAATNLLLRAVEMVPAGRVRGSLLVDLGEALSEGEELDRASAALEEGIEIGRGAGDAHTEWLGRILLAEVRASQEPEGAAEQLAAVAEAAIAAREVAADEYVLAAAWGAMATVHDHDGRMDSFAQAVDRAAAHARLAGDLAAEVRVAGRKSPYFIWGPGTVGEGLRYADEVLEGLGHVPGVREFALHLRAHMRARLGEFDGAIEAIREYRRRIHELGRRGLYASTAGCVWDVCLWAGQWAVGEEVLLEAFELVEHTGDKAQLGTSAIDLAEAHYRQGRLIEADRLCRVAGESSSTDDAHNRAKLLVLRARIVAAQGDHARAESLAREAIGMVSGASRPELGADARLELARILRATGDPGAQAAATEALELYERKGNVVGASWARSFLQAGAASSR